MADTTLSVPTATELQELLTRLMDLTMKAHRASFAHDDVQYGTPEWEAQLIERTNTWGQVGLAENELRFALRRAGTALDHHHGCEKPTPAGLVREIARLNSRVAQRDIEVARLHRENERLRDQVDTLGGNSQGRVADDLDPSLTLPRFVDHAVTDATLIAACGRPLGRADGHIGVPLTTVLVSGDACPKCRSIVAGGTAAAKAV